jgi:hypothetical protein
MGKGFRTIIKKSYLSRPSTKSKKERGSIFLPVHVADEANPAVDRHSADADPAVPAQGAGDNISH